MTENQNLTNEKKEDKEVTPGVKDVEINKKPKKTKLIRIVKHCAGFIIGSILTALLMALGAHEMSIQNENLLAENETLQSKVDEQSTEISDLESKVNSAKPWFDMKTEEKNKIREENAKAEAARKAEEEKKAEAARLEKEQKEKNKYNTELTYDEIARNPEQTLLKNCKFTGEVVQVLEGTDYNNLRVAINGDYDKMMLVEYDPSILSTRILEDDNITLYGTSAGVTSYTSTMGQKITIPTMLADKIDIN